MMHVVRSFSFSSGRWIDADNFLGIQFRANVVGAVHTINAFLPLVLKGPTKKIIVVSSVMGSPHYAVNTEKSFATAYAISKAGLNMAVAKYAVSPANREAGLMIVAVSPGFMKSIPVNSPMCE